MHGKRPAGDLASLGRVKETNILPQEGVKQVGAYSEVEAGHAHSEQATPDPCEYCTPERHTNQLQGCLLKHLVVRLYGCVVYDLAGEVWHQSLPQSCGRPCTGSTTQPLPG